MCTQALHEGMLKLQFHPQGCDDGSGPGAQIRECINPPPEHGGLMCEGDAQQVRVRGCSTACMIGGTKHPHETSSLTHVAPSSVLQTCNDFACPAVDGVWSDWGECSEPCEWPGHIGIQERFCIEPQFGGAWCEGSATQVRDDMRRASMAWSALWEVTRFSFVRIDERGS